MRQDPDIVMIAEIFDQETAEIAVDAALTGHQVLRTMHFNDAPGDIDRHGQLLEPASAGGARAPGCRLERVIRRPPPLPVHARNTSGHKPDAAPCSNLKRLCGASFPRSIPWMRKKCPFTKLRVG